MSIKKALLVLFASAVMLVGCKEPIGLPSGDVHAATVAVESCGVYNGQSQTGHVDWYQGVLPIYDYYVRTYGTITRGYYESDSRAYPRKNGFCIFGVPDFTPSDGTIIACTLYYYQSAHNGSADLILKWVQGITSWPGGIDDDSLYWRIWNSTDTMAVHAAQASDGWYKVALTIDGCMAVLACKGNYLFTGWVYPGYTNNTYADVSGAGANAPYIKVWYEE